jgi:hypothetical protein
MTRRSDPGGRKVPRDPAAKRVHTWLRGLRKSRDMRFETHQRFVDRAREIVAAIGGEPNIAQLDLVERYCHVVAQIEDVEAAQRAGEGKADDLSALMRLSERLLKQAKALNALPQPPAPVDAEQSDLSRSFAASFSVAMKESEARRGAFHQHFDTNAAYADALRGNIERMQRELALAERRDPSARPVDPKDAAERFDAPAPPPPTRALPAPPEPRPPTGGEVLPPSAPTPPTARDVTPSKPPRLVEERAMGSLPRASQDHYARLDGTGGLADRLRRDLEDI